MNQHTARIGLVIALAMLATAPVTDLAAAEDPIDLEWDSLIPSGGGLSEDLGRMLGVIQHGEMAGRDDGADEYAQVVTDYDGKTVRLPGYMVPLDIGVDGVTEFLLVPYFGACIHVPPPPPNQIVFVTASSPYRMEALFEPVVVTGTFQVATIATDLAEVGYTMAAESVTAYEY